MDNLAKRMRKLADKTNDQKEADSIELTDKAYNLIERKINLRASKGHYRQV
jgi:DNA-binding XRE family transcriptional regulator